jgi:3-hydroxyisobutyrate dehydrogenase
MRVAIIGAGVMGGGSCIRPLTQGHADTHFDPSYAVVAPLLARGAARADSAAAAAAGQEYTMLFVPNATHVRAAMTGDDGVLAGADKGSAVLEMSTVGRDVVIEMGELADKAGVVYVDAPVASSRLPDRRPVPEDLGVGVANIGRQSAAAGNQAFFVGGTDEAFAQVAPLLDCLGIQIAHMGPLGAGAATKMANNAIVGAEVVLISQALVIAQRAGIDPTTLLDVLLTTSASSVIMQTHMRNFAVKGDLPQGLFPVDYMVKDTGLAVDLGKSSDTVVTMLEAANEVFAAASAAGLGSTYNPVVFEDLASLSASEDWPQTRRGEQAS